MNGCSIDTTLTITEPTFVFSSAVTATNATCITGGTATATISGGNTGNYTYSWSNSASSSTNSMQDVQSNLSSNTYSVTITDSKGCITISTTNVSAPNIPTATASQATAATCGNNDGEAVVVGSGGSGNYTYLWSTSATGATINNLSANTYTVTVTDDNGCSATSTTNIVNNNGPSIASQNVTGTCTGKTTGQASITISGGTGPYTYSWSDGTTSATTNLNSQISNLNSGTYTLTVSDGNSCTAIGTAIVTLFPLPNANAGSDQTITNGTSIQLTATGGISYLWSPTSSLNNSGISNPLASPTTTTTYTVIVTDVNSCTATDDVKITVIESLDCGALNIFLPTAFSPNNDGQNDVLYVRANQTCVTTILFLVFDRWGEKVFESSNISNGWDGNFKGQKMDTGVFVYKIIGKLSTSEAFDKSGNVMLVR